MNPESTSQYHKHLHLLTIELYNIYYILNHELDIIIFYNKKEQKYINRISITIISLLKKKQL